MCGLPKKMQLSQVVYNGDEEKGYFQQRKKQ